MLCLLGAPFESSRHVYEIKWDGFRSLAFIDADGLRLVGRRKTDFTDRFPELGDLAKLPRGTVLDGEIVQMTAAGKPDFAALLKRERSWSGSAPANRNPKRHPPTTFVAFDLLYEAGQSIMDRPLLERHARLQKIVGPHTSARLAISEQTPGGQGLALFDAINRLGLEGVVAKRIDAPYEPGERSGAWTKFKHRQELIATILGYEPNRTGGVKSLILAADVEGEATFIGQVGSGLSEEAIDTVLRENRENPQPAPAVPCKIRHGRWIRPTLMCRVSFAEWTDAVKLRQPVFESMYAAGRPTPNPTRRAKRAR